MAEPRGINGWRNGNDPALRWLRIGATVLLLTIFAITAIVPDANAISGGVALTGALILLGYETLPIKGVGRNGRE